ncbi:hypothetical protein ACTJKC_06010 [Pedobacter sp. 22226]|uniref:hypothetical protein n=1 Tax=Pedobacter sp. 22226 TaxID=3453894 RepID=UPI003F82AC7A
MHAYLNTEINRNTQRLKSQHTQDSTITKNLERQLSDTVRFNMPQLIHSEGNTGKRDDSISSVNAIPKSGKLKQYLEVPKYENIPIEHGMKSKIAISGQYHTMLTQSDTMLFNALNKLCIWAYGATPIKRLLIKL